jgi:tRNA dimethylallyltransferase
LTTPSPAPAIVGPTCVGKTGYVIRVLERFPVEVINLDSFQVFDHFVIGTGRADAAYGERGHLYGVVAPGEELSPEAYALQAKQVCGEIAGRGRFPLFEGGSISYLRALMAETAIAPIVIVPPDDSWIEAAIERRLEAYDRADLFEEIKAALKQSLSATKILSDDVVYLPAVEYLQGKLDLETARHRVVSNLARRAREQLAAYESVAGPRVVAGQPDSLDRVLDAVGSIIEAGRTS